MKKRITLIAQLCYNGVMEAVRSKKGEKMQKPLTIKEALAMPYGEFLDGACLYESDDIRENQAEWGPEDGCRDFDFTTCPYWVTTNDGMEPIGIMDDAEFSALQKQATR